MTFLEKQVDRANTAFQSVGRLEGDMKEVYSKCDLLELGQQDLIKKFKIVEAYALGLADEQAGAKRAFDSLFLQVQHIQANTGTLALTEDRLLRSQDKFERLSSPLRQQPAHSCQGLKEEIGQKVDDAMQ